jgi:hypothetical protein
MKLMARKISKITAKTAKKTAKKTAAKRAAAPAAKPRETTPKTQSRKAAKPVLLAGGNPQIAKGEGDSPVQAYIDAMPGWKRDVGHASTRSSSAPFLACAKRSNGIRRSMASTARAGSSACIASQSM